MKDIGELLRSLHNCKCGNCSECQYRTEKHTYGPFGCTTRVMKDAEEAICELSVSCKEWKERGANIIIYANQLMRAEVPEMQKAAELILENHRAEECDAMLMPFKDIIRMIPAEE